MAIQAGLFLIPTERQVLTRFPRSSPLDLPTWSQQQGTIEEANGGRDYGVGLNGALLGDHRPTARASSTATARRPRRRNRLWVRRPAPATRCNSRDAFSTTCSTPSTRMRTPERTSQEEGAGIAGFYQAQGDYKGYGGDAFFDWPVLDGDAVTVEADYIPLRRTRLHVQRQRHQQHASEQYSVYSNAGYYFCNLKLQPFVRYEFLKYTSDVVNLAKAQQRFGVGFTTTCSDRTSRSSPTSREFFRGRMRPRARCSRTSTASSSSSRARSRSAASISKGGESLLAALSISGEQLTAGSRKLKPQLHLAGPKERSHEVDDVSLGALARVRGGRAALGTKRCKSTAPARPSRTRSTRNGSPSTTSSTPRSRSTTSRSAPAAASSSSRARRSSSARATAP